MVCLLLELSTLFCLGFNHSLDLVEFTLSLLDGVPSLINFVTQVIVGGPLQVVLTLCIVEFIG